jgi:hypothetical protein
MAKHSAERRARGPVAAAMLACLLGGLLSTASARAVPIRIRGEAQLEGHARYVEEGWLELRAQLTTDSGSVIEQAPVEIDTEGKLSATDLDRCASPRTPAATPARGGAIIVTTNPLGELCLKWRNAPAGGRIGLRFAGDAYHGSAETSVSYDRTASQRLWTTLRFDPRPSVIELDRDTALISATLLLRPSSALGPREGLPIELRNGRGQLLAETRTSGDGRAHFTLATSALPDPSEEELRVVFRGNPELTDASDEQRITLRAAVPIAFATAPPRPRVGDSWVVSLELEPRRGVVDDGVVQASVDGTSLATGPVADGKATLSLELGTEPRPQVQVEFRYLPASPWWAASAPLRVAVPIEPRSPIGVIAWSVLVLAAAFWTVQSWRRARQGKDPARPQAALAPGVHLVRPSSRRAEWSGVVVDAHEGEALAGATIVVRTALSQPASAVPDGPKPLVIHRSVTDETGGFGFKLADVPPGPLEIVVSRATHSTEQRALPPAGTLRVAMITRRRNVLRRFVGWARARGEPFFKQPEPTPLDVRQAAGDATPIAEWAAEVQWAAFGPRDVDEKAEQRLREQEPPLAPAPGTAAVTAAPTTTTGPSSKGID